MSSSTAEQFLYGPFDRKVSQIRVVLPNADKEHRHVRGMDNANKRSNHVANGVALRDDEAIQRPA